MTASKTVTVTLPTGARVTCSAETAQKLGLQEQSTKKTPTKRAASTKSND